MIEAILLLGLLACGAALWGMSKRVGALERRIAELAADVPMPAFAPPAVEAPPRPFAQAESTLVPAFVREAEPAPPPASPPKPETVAAAPSETAAARAAALFERFVGGRLLVWTGGIAIALAGLFLVRYSIERGLISPAARMTGAGSFGLALLGAGEWARRRFADDPRIGQALVGAGVLILYAAAYGAHVLYGLIALPTAFALMAAVAGAALALSIRHGAPAAALGLLAGFATPLLVGDVGAGAVPLLGYLALLDIAVFAVAVRTERPWLAWAARWLTLAWTGWLMASAPERALTIGAFVAAFTLASVHLLRGRDERRPSLAPGLALLQLGSMVAADFAPAQWLVFLLFAGAGFAGAGRYPALAATPDRALLGALLLIGGASALGTRDEAPAAAAVALLFGAGAWLRLGRDAAPLRWTWIFCLAAAGPGLALRAGEPGLLAPLGWAALFAALSLAPAAWAWRTRGEARVDPPFGPVLPIAALTFVVLAGAAAADALPFAWLPAGWLLVAAAALAGGRALSDGGVLRVAAVAAGAGALAAAFRVESLWETLAESLVGVPALVIGLPPPGRAALLLGLPALLFAAMWRLMPAREAQLARSLAAAAGLFALAGAYVLYKHGFALRDGADFVARGFAERALLTQTLFAGGAVLLARRGAAWIRTAGWALTALAAARFAWFDLGVLNPGWAAQAVGSLPVANLLLPAYGASAFWLWRARGAAGTGRAADLLFALFVAALVAGVALGVRQAFAGSVLVGPETGRAEFYGYSLAGLLLAVALLVAGWRRRDTRLRVAGLALLSTAVVKVFLVDAAALEGILRILSFAGLGVALIGMGKLYGVVLGRQTTPRSAGSPAEASA